MGAHPVQTIPPLRRLLAVTTGILTAATVTAATVTAGAGTAVAATALPQPTVNGVQRKLAQLTTQESQVGQHYDQVSQELASAHQRVVLVGNEVSKYHTQFQAMRVQIAQIAAVAYEDGSMTSTAALLTSGSPQVVLSQSAYLTHLSTDQNLQLREYIALARQLTGAQQDLRRTQRAVAALKRKLATQKAALNKLIARQKGILATLTAQQAASQLGGGGSGGTYNGPTKTQGEKAVAYAFMVLNAHTPYVWGGTGPPGPNGGYDCSGLVMEAWASAGVSIPRTSYAQWSALPHIPMSQIRLGDLVFFNGESHVAIYVGHGMIIDAPQPGMYVEEVSLSSSWYAQNLDGAARP